MENLPNDIEALKEIIRHLLEKIQRLEAENAELRRRLGMDSTNSDQPPSSDGYRKKRLQPGLPKKAGKSSGGQLGHKGTTLERVANPEYVEVHLPKQCQCCGRLFGAEEEYEIVQSRQVFDLPEPKLEITEHQLGQITCCEVKQQGEYPLEVNSSVQYGARVRALVVLLSVEGKMPLAQISQLFENLYGYNLNSQTIIEILERGYELAAPLEEHIKATLREAEVIHVDETGIRAEGKLHWLHTASNEENTHLYLHEKRGTDALNSEDSILPEFKGRVVHDCWSPYFSFNQAKHALCGAHLLRELNGLIEEDRLWALEMHEFLLDCYNAPPPITAKEEIYQHYQIILDQADREEPPPQMGKRGRPKNSRGRNLLNRLRSYQESVLAFAFEDSVPFTNNQAERDLRPTKVKLKVCGGFRTFEGGIVHARLQALLSTLRKRRLKVFAQLHELFSLRLALLA